MGRLCHSWKTAVQWKLAPFDAADEVIRVRDAAQHQ
jgi:hypothetical protein